MNIYMEKIVIITMDFESYNFKYNLFKLPSSLFYNFRILIIINFY